MRSKLFLLLLAAPLLFAPLSKAQNLFDRWDQNSDGKLSKAELPEAARANFERVDSDRSGFISRKEHEAFLNRRKANRTTPQTKGMVAHRDLNYAGTDNPRQTLDLYLPDKLASTNLPLVVFIHGGGWKGGNKGGGVNKVRPLVQSGEYAGASIAYRLSDEAQWPAQIHDCKAAIRWLRGNARQHGIDPERIAVWGTSAGGHLVAMLGTSADVEGLEGEIGAHDAESSRVQAVVNYYGPANLLTMNRDAKTLSVKSRIDHDAPDSPESKLIGGPIQERKEATRKASPLTHVTKDDAPMIHVHGDVDALVPHPQSVAFNKALEAAGVDSVLLTIKGGGHGGFRNREIQDHVVGFLNHHLRGKGEPPASQELSNE